MDTNPISTDRSALVLFGEATRGKRRSLYLCQTVQELFQFFGEPPRESEGLFYAIQTLLYRHPLIYYRVREEGVNSADYLFGLHLLKKHSLVTRVGALFLPRMGDTSVLHEGFQLLALSHGIMVMQERDFYDFMTAS